MLGPGSAGHANNILEECLYGNEGAGRPRYIVGRLKLHASQVRFKPALVWVGAGLIRQYSYGDALQETRRWAWILILEGVRPGDRVFMALKHRPETYFCFLGAMWIGAIPTIIPFPTPKQEPGIYWAEYRGMFAHIEPRVIVTYAENID